MSLAIVFKGSEGIVLAADSRVTLSVKFQPPGSKDQWLIPATYDNATKLLKVSGQEHVAAVTYDQGTIGSPEPRTAHSLLPEFEAELAGGPRLSVEEFAKALSDFFLRQWNARVPPGIAQGSMRFLVGGFDEGAAYGRIFEVAVPAAPAPVERTAKEFGIQWGGQTEITGRILNGHDAALLGVIKNKFSLQDADVEKIGREISEQSAARIPYQFLPLQDCVDLAILLVRTTSQLMDYQTNVRGVGGAIDVATITRQEGFRYIQCKEIRGERGRA